MDAVAKEEVMPAKDGPAVLFSLGDKKRAGVNTKNVAQTQSIIERIAHLFGFQVKLQCLPLIFKIS